MSETRCEIDAKDAIEALEFYPSGDKEIHCRLWDVPLSRDERAALAKDLNEAVAPVKSYWAKRLRDRIITRLDAERAKES